MVEPYLWVIETRQGPWTLTALHQKRLNRTYERLKRILRIIEKIHNNIFGMLNRTYEWLKQSIFKEVHIVPIPLHCIYEWYFAFAELIVLYEYYELFR